jgi:hypothetical protein
MSDPTQDQPSGLALESAEPADAGDAKLAAELDALLAAAEPAEAVEVPPVEPAAPAIAAVPEDEEERLLQRARERQAQRRQHEPLEHVQRELAELKQQLARAPGLTAISQAVAAKDPAALGAALRAAGLDPSMVQQLATKAQLGPTPADLIKQQINEALAPVLDALKPKPAPEAEVVDHGEAITSYVAYVDGAAQRFPLQAAMGDYAPHAAIAWIQRKFYANGADPETVAEVSRLTHEQVAVMFERELGRQRDARAQPSGAPTIASGEQHTQPPGAPSTASGGPTKSTSAPRSITNGHVATAARSTPRTAREVDAELARDLEDMKRAM